MCAPISGLPSDISTVIRTGAYSGGAKGKLPPPPWNVNERRGKGKTEEKSGELGKRGVSWQNVSYIPFFFAFSLSRGPNMTLPRPPPLPLLKPEYWIRPCQGNWIFTKELNVWKTFHAFCPVLHISEENFPFLLCKTITLSERSQRNSLIFLCQR